MRRRIRTLTTILFTLSLAVTDLSADTIFLDGFELCRTASVVEWDGGGDGRSWGDPLNWVGDTRPVNGDAVAIRAPASVTVEYGTLTTTLTCLGVTSTLLVSSGEMVLDGPATIKADLAITGGRVTANALMSVDGAVDLGPGILQGSGTVTVHGPFTWTGGSQFGSGATIANGGLEISGADKKFLTTRTLTLNAASSWTGSGELDLRFGATINVDAPFDIATDADMVYPQGNVPSLNISGSLTKSAGAGLTTISTLFNNNGSIVVNSGQLAIGLPNASGSSSGEFTVAAGSTLTVSGNQIFDASSSFSGAGGLAYDGDGTAVIQGAYDLTGPLGVSSGTLQFAISPAIPNDVSLTGGILELQTGATVSGNVAIDSGTLLASGPVAIGGTLQQPFPGTVDGSGTVTVDGLFTWTGGSQFGSGATIANGGLEISGADKKFLTTRTLTLNAASSWTGSGELDLRFGATINVDAPFDIATDADMVYPQGNVPSLNISGSLTKSAGAGLTTISTLFNNNGSIVVNSGQLAIGLPNASGSSSGEFTVAAGSTLTVSGNQIFDASSSFSGAGGLAYDGDGTAVIQGAYDLTGPLGVSSGTLQFAISPAIPNDVSLTGGILELQTGATVSGNVAIDSGTLLASGPVAIGGTLQQPFPGTVDGSGTVTVDGLFTWTGGSQFGSGATIANGGLEISGADKKFLRTRTLTLNAASSWTGSGELDLRFGATVNVDAPFDIATDADMVYPQGNVPSLNISGSLTKSAGAGNTQISAAVGNSGSIAVTSGQLSFLQNYQQNNSGTLHVDIAGIADFDAYAVTQAATLDGTLEIHLSGGYEPLLGETFEIMTANPMTGPFATVNGTAIVAGRKFAVTYGANNVTLAVVPE